MPSVFSALENQLSAACDGVFGESFVFQPYAPGPGGGRGGPDGSRATRTVTGIFDDTSFSSRALGEVERTASQVMLRHVKVSIDRAQFAGQPPRRLDRLTRVSTSVTYDIAAVGEDGEGRLRLRLTEITNPG